MNDREAVGRCPGCGQTRPLQLVTLAMALCDACFARPDAQQAAFVAADSLSPQGAGRRTPAAEQPAANVSATAPDGAAVLARERARRAIWRRLPGRRSDPSEPVWAEDDVAVRDLTDPMDDLEDLAVATHVLVRADYAYGNMSGDGSSDLTALDLGGRWYYVTSCLHVDYGTQLLGAVPKAGAEAVFADLETERVTEAFANGGAPTALAVRDLDRPAVVRAIARGIQTSLRGYGVADAEASLSETVFDYQLGGADFALDPGAVWREVVRVPAGAADTVPPDLAAPGAASPAFLAWVADRSPVWADAGEALDELAARALRLACLFVAADEAQQATAP